MRKILAIDGGGMRGIIPATVLVDIERRTGRSIADLFDLIAGTSTGGVLALGLSVAGGDGGPRFAADEVLDLYRRRGGDFFDKSFWRNLGTLSGLTDEKYSDESLEALLFEYLGDEPLGAAVTNVLISSYHLEGRRPYFFKSWRDQDKPVPMRQAARATGAAPTYFTPAQVTIAGETYSLVDGGVFANNPAMCAYAEARRLWPDEDLLVLSIGTGENTQPIPYAAASDWGLAQWAMPIMGVVFDGVNDAVHYQLDLLLPDSYYRLQLRLSQAGEAPDDTSPENVNALLAEGGRLVAANEALLATVCGRLTAAG